MKLPEAYDDDFFKVECGPIQGGKCVAYSIVYPPIGFFPFASTGNGDYHGFYWPIGREESPPIVAYSSHDAYALIPEYGDLTAAGRCQIAQDEDRKLTHEFDSVFAAANLPIPTVGVPDVVAVDDHQQLLSLDPKSPFRNCAVADQYVTQDELLAAEKHYRRAIDLLPEYAAAHFGLGYLLRRTKRQSDASIHLRMSLICPLAFCGSCFWADHILPGSFRNDWARKALHWLKQIKQPDQSLHHDPFMKNVQRLTLETGTERSTDIELLTELVEECRQRGQFLDAIYIWLSIGDRAAMETTSFRERYGMTARTFGSRLAELFRSGGLERRAQLTDNLISIIKNPDGLHL